MNFLTVHAWTSNQGNTYAHARTHTHTHMNA